MVSYKKSPILDNLFILLNLLCRCWSIGRCRVLFYGNKILRYTLYLRGVEGVIPHKFNGLRDSWGWGRFNFRQLGVATPVILKKEKDGTESEMYLFQFLSVPSDQNHPPHFRSQCLNYLSVQYPTPDHVLQKPSIVREEMPKIKKSTNGFVLCKNLAGKNLFQKWKVMMHENSRFPVVDRPE